MKEVLKLKNKQKIIMEEKVTAKEANVASYIKTYTHTPLFED